MDEYKLKLPHIHTCHITALIKMAEKDTSLNITIGEEDRTVQFPANYCLIGCPGTVKFSDSDTYFNYVYIHGVPRHMRGDLKETIVLTLRYLEGVRGVWCACKVYLYK